MPTQANSIFIKNLDTNEKLKEIYRDEDALGSRRFAGLYQPENKRDSFYIGTHKERREHMSIHEVWY